jgi:hypothetical protein
MRHGIGSAELPYTPRLHAQHSHTRHTTIEGRMRALMEGHCVVRRHPYLEANPNPSESKTKSSNSAPAKRKISWAHSRARVSSRRDRAVSRDDPLRTYRYTLLPCHLPRRTHGSLKRPIG